MPPEPPSREELVQDVEARRAKMGQETEQHTALPLAVFEACDPMVEAKLLDDVVTQVFLQHMSKSDGTVTSKHSADIMRDNEVTAEEIRDLMAELDRIEEATAPDLRQELPQERLWILADIAKLGGGVARQRATQELRDAMGQLGQWEGVTIYMLEELQRLLRDANSRGDAPVLFFALESAAGRALEKMREESPPA